MPFACLFIPDFVVQAMVRLEPELKAKAVAVVAGAAPLTRVFGANSAARALGVEVGMTKVQVEAFDGVALRWRSQAQEATAYRALLDCAWTISPRVEDKVGNEKEELRDAAVLDLAGCEKLFGSLEKIAGDLQRAAESVGFQANVAIAENAEAAVCAARGFNGVTILAAGEEGKKLGTLPVATLPMAEEFLETLARWGIRTCGEFAALPEVAVVERFGQEMRRWQLLAKGADPRPLMAREPELVFEEHMELEYAVELLDQLLFVLNRLLEQLCARLRMHVLAASEIHVKLTLERNREEESEGAESHPGKSKRGNASDSETKNEAKQFHERVLRLPVPARESNFVLKLLKLDLEAHPPGAAVTAVNMVAVAARSLERQMGLYLPLSPEPEKLEVTLARISATVGEGRVGAPVLLDTHRPNAFRQEKFVLVEVAEKRVAEMDSHASEREANMAALRIYRPALPATVELCKSKPVRIICDGVQRRVLSLAGPWRTKGDWWAETVWARDEWDVLMPALRPKVEKEPGKAKKEETAVYRIYRDLRLRRWFVEGIYD